MLKVESLERNAVSYFLGQNLQVVVGHVQGAQASELPDPIWKLPDPVLSQGKGNQILPK